MRRRTYVELLLGGLGVNAGETPARSNSVRQTSKMSQAQEAVSDDVNWSFSTDLLVTASPTVVDGEVIIGDTGGTLYSINTQDGTENWQTELDGGIGHAVNVVPGDASLDKFETDLAKIAFVGTAAASVYAIDTRTGDVVWDSSFDAQQATSPIAIENNVIAMLGQSPGAGGPATMLRRNGEEDGGLFRLGASAVTVNTAHYIPGGNLKDIGRDLPYVLCGTINNAQPFFLDAFSFLTGEILWSVELEGVVYATPTVLNDAWYFATGRGDLYSVDVSSGERQWKTSGFNGFFTAPTAYENEIYFVDRGSNRTTRDSVVYAVEPASGAFRWTTELDGRVRGSAPTVVDDSIYLCDQSGRLYTLNRDTGDISQQRRLGKTTISSAPTVVDGTLCVGAENGTVYAVDIASEESSTGTRVRRGASGHHFTWAGTIDPNQPWKRTQILATQRLLSSPKYGAAIGLVDTDEILIGAPGIDAEGYSNLGRVDVFTKTDNKWNRTQSILPDDPEARKDVLGFGRDIAVDGETAIIGTNDGLAGTDGGKAFVYSQSDGEWSLQQQLTPDQELTDARYGSYVGLVGETAVVVAPNDVDGRGAAYIFTNEDGTWTQTQRITPPTEQATLGIVDSANDRLFFLGSDVHVYAKIDENWILRTTISTGMEDPISLAVRDGVLLVGARNRVKVFEGERFDWDQTARLVPEAAVGVDPERTGFGRGVAISGDEILIGAPLQKSYTQVQGVVHRSQEQGGEWTLTDQINVPRITEEEIGITGKENLGSSKIGQTIAATDQKAVIGEAGPTRDTVGVYEPSDKGGPAKFIISDISPNNTSVTVGDEIDVSATIENTSGQQGTQSVEFRIVPTDGNTLIENASATRSQNVTLDAGDSTTVTFENVSTAGFSTGEFTHGVFSANDSATATITVDEAVTLEGSVTFDDKAVQNDIEILTVDSANLTENGEAAGYVVVVHVVSDEFDGGVSAPVGVSGNLSGSAENITVDLNASGVQGDTLDSITENTTLRAMLHEISADSAFGPAIQINGSTVTDDANITVEQADSDGDIIDRYDEDGDGLETSELLTGIDDWRGGEIETQELLTLIDSWRSNSSA